jgi:hypothetical protein
MINMPQTKSYKAEVTLAFDYKANASSNVIREVIEPERIAYLMIENVYENVNILPVIYVSAHLSTEMYEHVVNSPETSKFYLKIRKKDAMSSTSIYKKVLEDTFTYVTSSMSANYSANLNDNVMKDSTYRTIMIGLVSENMTNELRKNYNAIYNDIDQEQLVKMALDGLGDVVLQPLKHNKHFESILIPPMSSRYKLLTYLFESDAFYDSNFTFFMDFNKTYLVSKNSESVGDAPNVIINIKDYTAQEAYNDGFNIENGAYVLNINAANTNIVINNATTKTATNVIGYSDEIGTQDLNITTLNNTEGNTKKTIYVRSDNTAAIKNELESASAVIELLKQNIDNEIFTPDKVFDVVNYKDYSEYNGKYFLSYRRDFYYPDTGGEFILTCNVALKKAPNEEIARAIKDSSNGKKKKSNNKAKQTSSSSKKQYLKSTTRYKK